MGSVVSSVLGGGSPEPPPTPVQPKPAVRPSAVVNVGDKSGDKAAAKKKIRRGAYRQRIPSTVMGQEPTAQKSLLGQ
tara:strand:- start:19197 stop:19427 length:231 start_codon:yes stop_codon:yes gene_type:complete